MGIDRHFADFLLCAKDLGVDFSRVATLGRLNLFIDHRSLGAVFREHGRDITDSDIRAIRSASGGYVEELLRYLGAQETCSIDASGYEGASLVHDMNLPIAAELKALFGDAAQLCVQVDDNKAPVQHRPFGHCCDQCPLCRFAAHAVA